MIHLIRLVVVIHGYSIAQAQMILDEVCQIAETLDSNAAIAIMGSFCLNVASGNVANVRGGRAGAGLRRHRLLRLVLLPVLLFGGTVSRSSSSSGGGGRGGGGGGGGSGSGSGGGGRSSSISNSTSSSCRSSSSSSIFSALGVSFQKALFGQGTKTSRLFTIMPNLLENFTNIPNPSRNIKILHEPSGNSPNLPKPTRTNQQFPKALPC